MYKSFYNIKTLHNVCAYDKTKKVHKNGLQKRKDLTKGQKLCILYYRMKNKIYKLRRMSGTKIYKSYYAMLDRCYNKNATGYKCYGGRGIKVCERWRNSFKKFYKDMGDRPNDMQLDRIDNDGDYTPENCKWSTRTEQMRNRTNTVLSDDIVIGMYAYRDMGKTIKETAILLGISESNVNSVLYNGVWKL